MHTQAGTHTHKFSIRLAEQRKLEAYCFLRADELGTLPFIHTALSLSPISLLLSGKDFWLPRSMGFEKETRIEDVRSMQFRSSLPL
jgi:hypothetical protein